MRKPDPSDPFSNLASPKALTHLFSFSPIPLVPFVLLSCQVRKWQKSDLALPRGGFPREERSSLVREERRAAITPLSGLSHQIGKKSATVGRIYRSISLDYLCRFVLLIGCCFLFFQRRPGLPHDARAEQARGVEEGRLGARQGPRQR